MQRASFFSRSLLFLLILTPITRLAAAQGTDEPDAIPLRVAYVGSIDTARGRGYLGLLKRAFAEAKGVAIGSVTSSSFDGIDVVILDHEVKPNTAEPVDAAPEQPKAPPPSPLGARDAWRLPVVLLGEAVITQTKHWRIKGFWG